MRRKTVENKTIRVKALCLFEHKGKILAGKGYDKVKKEHFYRVLGGSIEFGETSKEAVRREIREELGCEIKNLKFLEIVENIFMYEGKQGHQIHFLYKGDLSDKSVYAKKMIHIKEEKYELDAEWVSIKDILGGKVILYPEYNYRKVFAEYPKQQRIT